MMNTVKIWKLFAAAIFMGIIICAGCRSATPPVAFYTLSSIRVIEAKPPQASLINDAVIGIGPVQFPDYLDRPQIVTRSGSNRLEVSEFNRWGGKLDQDFLNIFAENLSILLSTSKVIMFPWKGQANPDYRITLNIQQFEGENTDSVLLNVTWTIRGKEDGSDPLHIARSIIQQPVSSQGYDALVAAYSQAVAELSREVAASIIKIKD